jgi:hypothetical protein
MIVQIWTVCRQGERFDADGSEDLIKGSRKLGVPIMQQITATLEHPQPCGWQKLRREWKRLISGDLRPSCEEHV